MDDGYSGDKSKKLCRGLANDMELVLNNGGFSLKAVTFSGEKPPETMTDDGESISVGGIRWFPEEDLIGFNLGDMIFEKKRRGKYPKDVPVNVIPKKLTRKHCVSKVHEVYDLTGKVTPLTAPMKLDLHDLVKRKLKWDDAIPDDLRPLWESHFEMIQEMRSLRYKRCIVPPDAVSLNLETVDFGDASESLLCVAIYVSPKEW